ncbi:MAG: peptidase [Phenylobacterium sp.]|nr:peptidase [Phenylobacterium sp.]MDB5495496.1 peptidase [Phenylobacterium sp.]
MRLAPFAAAAAIAAALPAAASHAQAGPPHLAFPLACEIGKTCEIQHYVDRDPGPGVRDYHCGRRTYQAHNAEDIRLLDMAQQRRGVDVLAAAAGRVLAVRDGVPDISIRAPGAPSTAGHQCGNRVAIDHGGGWMTDYCHLALGSLRVKVGDVVAAGQPIAKVGLSGDTEFPHLHMSLQHGNQFVDPFAPQPGDNPSCGPHDALWTPQALQAMGYKAGAILNAGFAPRPVSAADVEAGGIPGATIQGPVIAIYARAIGLEAGDEMELTLRGPGGVVLASQRLAPLATNEDQHFDMIGRKRPATGWAHGTYAGEVRVLRSGKVALQKQFTAAL